MGSAVIYRDLVDLAGFGPNWPQALTFATQYILNGSDAFSLQQILGHSTLDMVKIYVRLANRDVVKLHRQFSPMDRMEIVPGGSRRAVVR